MHGTILRRTLALAAAVAFALLPATLQAGPGGPTPEDSYGLYNPNKGKYSLANDKASPVEDILVRYGPSTAPGAFSPLVGDLDGNPVSTPGFFNANQHFSFTNNNTFTPPLNQDVNGLFNGGFGLNVRPLVCDWDNDGIETPGVYNISSGEFAATNAATPPFTTDIGPVRFGPIGAGWVPVCGDWDGMGGDSFGLYNPNKGRFVLANSTTTPLQDLSIDFGPRPNTGNDPWVPLVGNWDQDAPDEVGFYNPVKGKFVLTGENANPAATLVNVRYGPVAKGWLPLAGDWDNM
jgi:hypothetical protein